VEREAGHGAWRDCLPDLATHPCAHLLCEPFDGAEVQLNFQSAFPAQGVTNLYRELGLTLTYMAMLTCRVSNVSIHPPVWGGDQRGMSFEGSMRPTL
jgi:hypothetical protein